MNEWTQCEAAEGVLLRITVGPGGVSSIEINPRRPAAGTRNDENHVLAKAVAQLHEYFAGRRRQFDLPLAPRGTDFQREVWKALAAIPYGQTRTYREIAEAVGAPRAVRAVGAANSRNTLPIVVPCHRVIGADGRLVGYAGGVTVKKMLLDLEASHAAGKAATEAATV